MVSICCNYSKVFKLFPKMVINYELLHYLLGNLLYLSCGKVSWQSFQIISSTSTCTTPSPPYASSGEAGGPKKKCVSAEKNIVPYCVRRVLVLQEIGPDDYNFHRYVYKILSPKPDKGTSAYTFH